MIQASNGLQIRVNDDKFANECVANICDDC